MYLSRSSQQKNRVKIRVDHGFAPTGKLEQRSSKIVSDELPLLLSGHDMVAEYNSRMFLATRRNQKLLVLDSEAAQSTATATAPDALLNRLLSQVSSVAAADLLDPDLQVR